MTKTLILALCLFSFNGFARETAPVASTTISKKSIDEALKDAYKKFKGLKEGKNANYIPALDKVDSELFGIVLVTMDGQVHAVGDIDKRFSIQSISKVFTMAQVLQEQGEKAITDSVGVVATGEKFNSIVAIEKEPKGHRQNSFVNPGAIATTSMVKGKSPDEIWNKFVSIHNAFAGDQLAVNQEVYKSESDTNQRNQAIGMLMHAYEIIKTDPKVSTDLYTRQCSLNVNAKDLAVMAATLANGG